MEPTIQKHCCSVAAPDDHMHKEGSTAPGASGAVLQSRDPVCGMEVDPASAKHRAEHDGETYYFCSSGCKSKFLVDPNHFLKSAAQSVPLKPSALVAQGTIYTCPMHPQIRRDAPGSCPICGMALEPEGIPEAEGSSAELKDMTRRFVIGAVLATPIFVLEMGGHWTALNLDRFVTMGASMWIQFALSTPIVLWCGWPFFERAWASVLNRSPNMFTLIGLGVGAAYLYSLVATIAPGLFPVSDRKSVV